jgi:hypothetical protein
LYHTYSQQNHKNARPYEKGCPLFNNLQILVPSDAKGKKAFHGRLAPQPPNNKRTLDEDGREEGGDDEGEQDEDDVENMAGTNDGDIPLAGASGSGIPLVHAVAPGPDSPVTAPDAEATNLRDDNEQTLSTASTSKRPFSTVDSTDASKSSTLPPSASASQAPSITGMSLSSSSSSKRGRLSAGAIALTHIGNNFADFNASFRYGIDKEQERHQARMAERQVRGQECQEAVKQVQETETYLTTDELAALLEVFEDHNSASTYLGIKTPELRKAWIRRKLVASKMTPSFD